MSEHQVYEFVALDRPLTQKEMDELRRISSRAEITSTRFHNEYHWGDLKADPAKLMERYFDAHLYFANWGSHRLMLRVPRERVDEKALGGYFVADCASASVASDHLLLDLRSDDEEPDYDDHVPGTLAALAPLRNEMMRGDLRGAYLAWLLAVKAYDVDDEAEEPPVPRGLAELTGAQQALVDFLRLDDDLIAAAAERSADAHDDRDAFRAWSAELSSGAKDGWLRRAVDDPELALGNELLREFRARAKPAPGPPPRTVAQLRAAADVRREARERAEAARAEKAKRAAAIAREKRLDALAKRLDAAWTELETLVATSRYDDALKAAIDLRDLAARDSETPAFTARLEAMRKRHIGRRGFVDRWKRANNLKRR